MIAALLLVALTAPPAAGMVRVITPEEVQRGLYEDALAAPPAEAAARLVALADGIAATPAAMRVPPDPALAADALWDAARVLLDRGRDPAAARPILERLIREHPDARPTRRAQAALARLDALGDAAGLWALPIDAEAAFIARHPDAEPTPLVAIRHATTLPEGAALDLLARFQPDSRWGWVVDRAIGRRLYAEGRYLDAWRTAGAADDSGRATASMRMMAWWTAPWLLAVLLIAAGLWWIRRRRRAG